MAAQNTALRREVINLYKGTSSLPPGSAEAKEDKKPRALEPR
jgi:hypothetical protein